MCSFIIRPEFCTLHASVLGYTDKQDTTFYVLELRRILIGLNLVKLTLTAIFFFFFFWPCSSFIGE